MKNEITYTEAVNIIKKGLLDYDPESVAELCASFAVDLNHFVTFDLLSEEHKNRLIDRTVDAVTKIDKFIRKEKSWEDKNGTNNQL